MYFIRNKSITPRKFIIGFLVVLMFLAPISTSLVTSSYGEHTAVQIYIGKNISMAAGPYVNGAGQNTGTTRDGTPVTMPDSDSSWGQTIGYAVLSTAAAITWVGGNLLEYSIDNLVFEMGEKLNTNGLGGSIDITWKVIRDICNLIFIFGFIYTGIRTIIDPESAETKRFVAQIIIAALLINFSLFFVKVITDFSNFAAVKIYTTMVSGTHDGDISTRFTELLGLKTLYHPPAGDKLGGITATGGIWFFILGAIMLLVAGFVLAAGGILLIVRFVALIFIMIFSPVLFAASVFPQTEEYSSKLWHYLLSYAFFAPLLLLLLLISITVLNGAMGALGITSDSLSGALVKADSYAVILNFVIVIMFLIFSLKTASHLGVAGGEMAVHMGDHLRQRGQAMMGNATAGLGAKIGRATAGRIAHNMSEDDKWKDRASQSGLGGWGARRVLQASRAVGDASFDARKIPGASSLGFGEGRKGGYKTVLKEVKETEEKYAKSLGEVGDDDARVLQRKKEAEYAGKSVEKDKEELLKLRKNREILQQELKNAKNDTDKLLIGGEINGLDEKIEAQKEHIHHSEEAHEKAKIKYEQEKMRRQVGSTFAQPEGPEAKYFAGHIAKLDEGIKKQEDQLKEDWNTLMQDLKTGALKDTDINAVSRRKQLQDLMNAVDTAKKERDLYQAQHMDRGYAGVLEGSSHLESWITGRLLTQDREAGKAMRKARKKGKPKDSGDHGGGHDAHGGDHGKKDDAHGGNHTTQGGGGGGHGAH